MRGKLVAYIVFLMLVSTTLVACARSSDWKKPETNINLSSLIGSSSIEPAPITLKSKPILGKFNYRSFPADTEVTTNELDDLNPAIVTDGSGDAICLYEYELDVNEFDIGLSITTNGGLSWSETGYFDISGSPTQPRVDLYTGTTAYGTWTADPREAFGYAYYAVFPDIRDPEAGEGWHYYYISWGETYGIGAPFTSSDVACYKTSTPPTPEFWGIVAFTGDNKYSGYEEDNTFMFQFNTEGGYVTIIFFYNMSYDVFDVTTDVDPSTGWCVIAADFVHEQNRSFYGTYLIAKKITSSSDWWRGEWKGTTFKNCRYPRVDVKNGYFYITAELVNEDLSTDIVCFVSNTPSNSGSWKGFYVTKTSGESERYPSISAINSNECTILYIKNRNVYSAITKDSGNNWEISKVNDDTDTAVEGYGCLDISNIYSVWTASLKDNKDIIFDIAGAAPALDISIAGGFGLKITIRNVGNAPAKNINYEIDIKGGTVILGRSKSGAIPEILPGDSVIIKLSTIGFGRVTIGVKVGDYSGEFAATLFGPFVFI